MSCGQQEYKDNMTFVNRIIHRAYRLAGVIRSNNTPTAEQIEDGINSLNQILAELGQNNNFIFFESKVSFQANSGQSVYKIGTAVDVDVETNPFISIAYMYYEVGDIRYTLEFKQSKNLSTIPVQNFSSYPIYYAYEIAHNYTEISLYPQTTGSEYITVVGRQSLSNVNLFQDASSVIPEYAVNALTGMLAQMLSALYFSEPSDAFKQMLPNQISALIDTNQQDWSLESGPTLSGARRWWSR